MFYRKVDENGNEFTVSFMESRQKRALVSGQDNKPTYEVFRRENDELVEYDWAMTSDEAFKLIDELLNDTFEQSV